MAIHKPVRKVSGHSRDLQRQWKTKADYCFVYFKEKMASEFDNGI